MAFTVQTDPPMAGANSYSTVAEFRTYHKDRGNTITFGSGDIQKALIRATDYLDTRFSFVGDRQQSDQTTEWPRLDAFDQDDRLFTGIPEEVKEATNEYAFISLTAEINPSPTLDATGRAVEAKREKVGPIEEETRYTPGAAFILPKYPKADNKLIRRGLVENNRTLSRA